MIRVADGSKQWITIHVDARPLEPAGTNDHWTQYHSELTVTNSHRALYRLRTHEALDILPGRCYEATFTD